MAAGVTNPPLGVQDPTGSRGISAVSTNTRARGTNGMLATQLDVVTFPGVAPKPMTGLWLVPNSRVSVAGVRTIGQTSQGMTFTVGPPGQTGPMMVVTPDPRIATK